METSLPTPMAARVELLIYCRVTYPKAFEQGGWSIMTGGFLYDFMIIQRGEVAKELNRADVARMVCVGIFTSSVFVWVVWY